MACWYGTGLLIERFRVRIPTGVAGEFSSPELTLCADSYSVSVPPPCIPQWHVKVPGHFAKSTGGRLHLNTHTPLTQRSLIGLTMPLSRRSVGIYLETSSHTNSPGNTQPQTSQLAEPLWTDPGLNSGISVRELISTTKKKMRRRGMNCGTFSPNPRTRGKSHHQHQSARLVIRRSRVRSLAEAAGERSSPELTLRADSHFGVRSTPALPQ